jgi:hypothetical protein
LAGLTELAAGCTSLLAQVAGLAIGFSQGRSDKPTSETRVCTYDLLAGRSRHPELCGVAGGPLRSEETDPGPSVVIILTGL